MTWKDQFTTELQRGLQARSEGNEGMARVCARRAAGEVVREYYQRQQLVLDKPSALHALRTLAQAKHVSPRIREIAAHFVWQITLEHTLPGDVDLLAEVQWLAEALLDPLE
ncbi:MAG TPA: hypothetical protein PK530_10385 [Anaerolineales bacterium]|nr:hypothetical protein [Anaerolineales bacterium]